jgi:hypothetical protein
MVASALRQDRFTATHLTEGALRSAGGVIINSSAHHVVALAETFGVHPSSLFDRGRKLLIVNQEALEILRDETLSAIAHKSLHLPPRDRQMILNIIRQFEEAQGAGDGHVATP